MATTRRSFSFGSVKFGNGMSEVSYPSLNAIGFGLDYRAVRVMLPWVYSVA
jgi:hypothetical protein